MKKLLQAVIALTSALCYPRNSRSQNVIDGRITVALKEWISKDGPAKPDMRLSDVAAELGVDKTQLTYYFKYVIGEPFSIWKKKWRIEKAKKLMLENPDMPVSAVGAAVGYPDKSNFRKRFSELESCTPAEWKSARMRE